MTRGTLTLATKDALVFDQGPFVEGFDELMFSPSNAPELVAIAGTTPPAKLSAPGCTRSLALAVSPDGSKVVTGARGTMIVESAEQLGARGVYSRM